MSRTLSHFASKSCMFKVFNYNGEKGSFSTWCKNRAFFIFVLGHVDFYVRMANQSMQGFSRCNRCCPFRQSETVFNNYYNQPKQQQLWALYIERTLSPSMAMATTTTTTMILGNKINQRQQSTTTINNNVQQ